MEDAAVPQMEALGFKLKVRQEEEWLTAKIWVDGSDEALVELGRMNIHIFFDDADKLIEDRRDRWVQLMQESMADVIRRRTGVEPTFFVDKMPHTAGKA